MTCKTAPGQGESLLKALFAIGLRYLPEHLDDFLARATRASWTPMQLVEEIARHESNEKALRSLQSRMRQAQIGRVKPMADFDWDWPQKINRTLVEELFSLDFVKDPRNTVLVGTQGLGKTMIAKNLAVAAVEKGYSALFVSASKIISDIGGQESSAARERRFKHYVKPSVLVIDELGYLSYDNAAADILFQIVNRRYEAKPIILTTNMPFREWSSVFPNAASASALVDRLTHHSHVILIKGDSYRKHEAQMDRNARKEPQDPEV